MLMLPLPIIPRHSYINIFLPKVDVTIIQTHVITSGDVRGQLLLDGGVKLGECHTALFLANYLLMTINI